MLYFDTSFLVPLIMPEATSEKIARFIRKQPTDQLTVSHWTRVEFSSLLGREVRMDGLSDRAAVRADARFEAMIEESVVVLLPNADDFGLAKEYLGQHGIGLRAGDATALVHRLQSPRRSDLQPRQDTAQGGETARPAGSGRNTAIVAFAAGKDLPGGGVVAAKCQSVVGRAILERALTPSERLARRRNEP